MSTRICKSLSTSGRWRDGDHSQERNNMLIIQMYRRRNNHDKAINRKRHSYHVILGVCSTVEEIRDI